MHFGHVRMDGHPIELLDRATVHGSGAGSDVRKGHVSAEI
jgi:hypothetical protein